MSLVSEAAIVRLDVWLWAARFYKTRSLAKAAIEGGKARVNGQPCKPAKAVHVGDVLKVWRGIEEMEIQVLALSQQRGNAAAAQSLYEELPESQVKRLAARETARLHHLGYQAPATKPDKRARRKITAFADSGYALDANQARSDHES